MNECSVLLKKVILNITVIIFFIFQKKNNLFNKIQFVVTNIKKILS